jgi:hypothetical protein
MRSKWNSLVVGGCNVFGLALLALSATAAGSTVRAEDPSALQSIVFEPLTKIVTGLESRVANLEASMAAFGESFAAKRIVARELCVADESGAQTCITKAQLDALLRSAMQTGQAAAATQPGETEQTASADRSVAPAAPVAAVEPPVAAEPGETEQAASADRSVAPVATVDTPPAIETPPAVETLPTVEPAATLLSVPSPQAGGARESATAEAMPEVAAAIPPETQPTISPPTAAAGEASTPLAVEATVPSASEPAETIVATDAKPAPLVTEERAAKDEEPARTGATETDTPAPELQAAPAEAPASQRAE